MKICKTKMNVNWGRLVIIWPLTLSLDLVTLKLKFVLSYYQRQRKTLANDCLAAVNIKVNCLRGAFWCHANFALESWDHLPMTFFWKVSDACDACPPLTYIFPNLNSTFKCYCIICCFIYQQEWHSVGCIPPPRPKSPLMKTWFKSARSGFFILIRSQLHTSHLKMVNFPLKIRALFPGKLVKTECFFSWPVSHPSIKFLENVLSSFFVLSWWQITRPTNRPPSG